MSSPTVRTMALLRRNGYLAGIVEKRNWFAGPPGMACAVCRKNRVGKTVDLFGWCDIVAVPLSTRLGWAPTVFVQTTSKSNHASRRRKIVDSTEARHVLKAGNAIWIVTWDQPGGYGTRWRSTVEELNLGSIEATPPVKRRKRVPADEEE